MLSVQPRIRLTRSFDQRSHRYLGYCLVMDGMIGEKQRAFSVGIGQAAHDKHQFEVGIEASGVALPVADPRLEPVEFYQVSKLTMSQRPEGNTQQPPPWHRVPDPLEEYQWRGHRRLSARTYESRCRSCIWGCRMPVVIIVDHWQPDKKRYRFETFCYGPLSCPIYKSGPRRRVPGRRGIVWEEPDWVDAEATSQRDWDE